MLTFLLNVPSSTRTINEPSDTNLGLDSKRMYCGADVFEEESGYEEITYNLRKYGYIVCPKCDMILFSEDLVDE